MEPSLYKYILMHSKRDQILLILLSIASLPLVYITLELPKRIINLLEGADTPEVLLGYEFNTLEFLMIFSFAFLLTVLLSGGLKYLLNVYRGALGERLLELRHARPETQLRIGEHLGHRGDLAVADVGPREWDLGRLDGGVGRHVG